MTGGDITKPTDEHRWVLYDVDFQTGKVTWQRVVHAAVPSQSTHQKNSYASETPVTDGERVYVYLGYAGLFAFDMNGKPVWSKPMTAPKMRSGLGLRGVARASRRPPLHRQRQRRAIVRRGIRRAHGERTLAHQSRGRSLELVDAVRLAQRRADGNRHDRQQEGAIVRH